MSTQERKKAWFVEGLRLLPKKIKSIQIYHLDYVEAVRSCREKATGDILAYLAEYQKNPDFIAWKTYQNEIVTEITEVCAAVDKLNSDVVDS